MTSVHQMLALAPSHAARPAQGYARGCLQDHARQRPQRHGDNASDLPPVASDKDEARLVVPHFVSGDFLGVDRCRHRSLPRNFSPRAASYVRDANSTLGAKEPRYPDSSRELDSTFGSFIRGSGSVDPLPARPSVRSPTLVIERRLTPTQSISQRERQQERDHPGGDPVTEAVFHLAPSHRRRQSLSPSPGLDCRVSSRTRERKTTPSSVSFQVRSSLFAPPYVRCRTEGVSSVQEVFAS